MKEGFLLLIGAVIGAMISSGSELYISYRETVEAQWTLPSVRSDANSPYIFEHADRVYWVCYNNGDGDFIYIDNKNSLDEFTRFEGNPANYPRIRLGDCEPVAGGDSVNIGFYLDTKNGATEASGTLRVIGD